MKVHIEIVTGFLGAGKTSFINALLSESLVDSERVLILQLEQGKGTVKEYNSLNHSIKVKKVDEVNDLREELIYSIKEERPNRIIIEYNGTSDIKQLFEILNEKIYRECSKITTVFFIANGNKLKQYVDNMGNFIIPFIQNANMIVVNDIDNCKIEFLDEGVKKVKGINPKAFILIVNNKYILNSTLRESKVLDNGYLKKLKIKIANNIKRC